MAFNMKELILNLLSFLIENKKQAWHVLLLLVKGLKSVHLDGEKIELVKHVNIKHSTQKRTCQHVEWRDFQM